MFKSTCKRVNILLIVFFLAGCRHEEPTGPKEIPKGVYVQKIAFVSRESYYEPQVAVGDLYNNAGIFKLYNIKALTKGLEPCLSKDQKWITYILYGNNLTLRRINADGTNDREISITTPGIEPQAASISPDNSTLTVLEGGFFTGTRLGIVPINGGEFKEIYDVAWSTPDWFQDSKRIIFSWMDVYNRFNHNVAPLAKTYIVSINKDGTDFKFISDTVNGLSADFEPNISPNGREIAFVSERSYPGSIRPEIFKMDIDGSNVQRLTEAISSEKKGDHYDYYTMDNSPKWLTDGEHIIFQRVYYQYDYNVNQYGRETNDLYIVNKNGTGLQNLTNNGTSIMYKK